MVGNKFGGRLGDFSDGFTSGGQDGFFYGRMRGECDNFMRILMRKIFERVAAGGSGSGGGLELVADGAGWVGCRATGEFTGELDGEPGECYSARVVPSKVVNGVGNHREACCKILQGEEWLSLVFPWEGSQL